MGSVMDRATYVGFWTKRIRRCSVDDIPFAGEGTDSFLGEDSSREGVAAGIAGVVGEW